MLKTAYYSSIGGREKNEDCVRVKTAEDGSVCLVVSDGVGGIGGGDRASFAAADSITRRWNGETAVQENLERIYEANVRIRAMQTRTCAMKTTIAMLALSGDRMFRAHAGDTRIYHFHNGRLVYQSRDHSAAQISVLLGDLAPEEIRFDPGRSRLLKALGQPNPSVESAEEKLSEGSHAFLLCTDGFWEYVYEAEMIYALRVSGDPEEWIRLMRRFHAHHVAEHCGENPCNDNHSAAAVWMQISRPSFS